MKEHKKQITLISAAALLFAAGITVNTVFTPPQWVQLVFYMPAWLLCGYKVAYNAFRRLIRGNAFDENLLMLIATVGAFAIGEYPEGAAVMVFYQIGELFNDIAVDKSRKSISGILALRPDRATLLKDGEELEVDPYDVQVGDTLIVRPGERVPLDGILLSGECSLDTGALTGEAMPRSIKTGETVLSGCINQSGVITLRVTGDADQSTVARILELVESASNRKAKAEGFISRFARWYTPLVTVAALLLAVIPGIITGQWQQWIHRGLIFLVLSCPCALVISVPLAFFGGMGGASKSGIIVKGGNYLEALAGVDTVAMDKTGTVTTGRLSVGKIHSPGMEKQQLLRLAAGAEHYSSHPIAQCLKQACTYTPAQTAKEQAGGGVSAVVDGKNVMVGNAALLAGAGIAVQETENAVHIAVDGVYAGYITLKDELKPDTADAIKQLHNMHINVVMLTGDNEATTKLTAQEAGIQNYKAQCLPQDKVSAVEQMLAEGKCVAFVGDGINDAPVLARADIGIAMGALGSDAAIEAADIVIMNDSLAQIPAAIKLARRTMRIVKQNIVFSLAVKAAVLILGALGIAGMWLAVFADVGVSVLAVLNAMRCLKKQK